MDSLNRNHGSNQRFHVHLHPGVPACLLRGLFHHPHEGRTNSLYQGYVHPAYREKARRRQEVHFVVPGAHGFYRFPRRYGQHCRYRHGGCHGRSWCRVLDVGYGLWRAPRRRLSNPRSRRSGRCVAKRASSAAVPHTTLEQALGKRWVGVLFAILLIILLCIRF